MGSEGLGSGRPPPVSFIPFPSPRSSAHSAEAPIPCHEALDALASRADSALGADARQGQGQAAQRVGPGAGQRQPAPRVTALALVAQGRAQPDNAPLDVRGRPADAPGPPRRGRVRRGHRAPRKACARRRVHLRPRGRRRREAAARLRAPLAAHQGYARRLHGPRRRRMDVHHSQAEAAWPKNPCYYQLHGRRRKMQHPGPAGPSRHPGGTRHSWPDDCHRTSLNQTSSQPQHPTYAAKRCCGRARSANVAYYQSRSQALFLPLSPLSGSLLAPSPLLYHSRASSQSPVCFVHHALDSL